MKVQKEFAPMTIRIETAQDLKDFIQILYAAARASRTWSGMKDTDTYEKVNKFLKELGEPYHG